MGALRASFTLQGAGWALPQLPQDEVGWSAPSRLQSQAAPFSACPGGGPDALRDQGPHQGSAAVDPSPEAGPGRRPVGGHSCGTAEVLLSAERRWTLRATGSRKQERSVWVSQRWCWLLSRGSRAVGHVAGHVADAGWGQRSWALTHLTGRACEELGQAGPRVSGRDIWAPDFLTGEKSPRIPTRQGCGRERGSACRPPPRAPGGPEGL